MLVFLFHSKSFGDVKTDVQPIMFEQPHEIRKAHLLKTTEEIKRCAHMV